MVPTGRINWKLETMTYSWPQTFTVVSVILLLFSTTIGAVAFSSQFVPIHFPLILSIVDFVCSSDQDAQDLIFFHRLESPTVWTVCQVFPLWEVVLHPVLVCCYQSPQIGCVFVTVNSVNSVNIPSFPSGTVLCVSLHGASSFSNNEAFFFLRQFCDLCRQFFVFSVSVFRCLLWRLLQWAHPLEHWHWILALVRRAISSFRRNFLVANFDVDDSISNWILRGFLTAADASCSLDVLDSNFGFSSCLCDYGVSNVIHITLEFISPLIHTTLHFILLRRLWIEFLREFDYENGWDPYWWPHWWHLPRGWTGWWYCPVVSPVHPSQNLAFFICLLRWQYVCWWCTIQSYEVL